jgi:hypothetical protein
MDDLDAYEYRLKFDACRAELAALRERTEAAEAALNVEVEEGLGFVGQSLVIADRLTRRVALLEGLLRSVEWGGELASTVTGLAPTHCCLFCFGAVTDGHAPDCRYVAALADGG